MSASKSERLLNLVICLLVANNYVTKERLRALIEPYRETSSDEAFEKMFERDKEDLRALGIPLEVGFTDKFFEDEQGYRIKRDAFELPPVEFTPQEAAVLGLAARVWQHAGLASATTSAVVKLQAAGVDVDREAIDSIRPTPTLDEPAFETVWEAVLAHRPLEFSYRRPGAPVSGVRHLHPWGVISAKGRWYVVGHDVDRGEPRMFRLSRIEGDVTTGEPDAFSTPVDVNLHELGQALVQAPASEQATVLVRTDAALALRRRAELRNLAVIGPDGDPGWDRLVVDYGSTETMAADILEYAGAVYVEAPEQLREVIVQRLIELDANPKQHS